MSKAIRSLLLVLTLIVVSAGAAVASTATGLHPTLLSRGTLSGSVHYNTGEVKFQTKGPVDFVTVTITLDALGSSGWHAHPGVALVTVKSGSLVFYDENCTATVYAAGTAFTESGDHAGMVRNESTTTPAVLYVTFIVPAGTADPRIEKDNPGCPQN